MNSSDYANCWRADDASEIGRFLVAFSRIHRPFPVFESIDQVCCCNHSEFSVALACDATRLICTACNELIDIKPPASTWDECVAEADGIDDYACEDCQGSEFNSTLGKTGPIDDSTSNHPIWLNIGLRCCTCNLLSCVNDFCWPRISECSFDPTWLCQLATQRQSNFPWLEESLARCTSGTWTNASYIRFVDSTNANELGAEWQYQETIDLSDPQMGFLKLDVLQDRRIGGIEFYTRLFTRQLVR